MVIIHNFLTVLVKKKRYAEGSVKQQAFLRYFNAFHDYLN
jgi:hypothetical protein